MRFSEPKKTSYKNMCCLFSSLVSEHTFLVVVVLGSLDTQVANTTTIVSIIAIKLAYNYVRQKLIQIHARHFIPSFPVTCGVTFRVVTSSVALVVVTSGVVRPRHIALILFESSLQPL